MGGPGAGLREGDHCGQRQWQRRPRAPRTVRHGQSPWQAGSGVTHLPVQLHSQYGIRVAVVADLGAFLKVANF